jgi:hypothetical protein
MKGFFSPIGSPQRIYVLLGLIVLVAAGCTDTVYKDRPPFNPPPDANSGFLGYFTASEQQTTCGNCHVGQQADWIQTRHATAWATLQADPAAEASCEVCHTVNSRGNQAAASVGYDAVKDPAYYDVQCESCHGAGFDHVQNPTTVATRPIPSIMVFPPEPPNTPPPTAADTAAIVNSGCGGCHQGAGPSRNHNYLKEWKLSRHGILNDHAAPSVDCQPCHEAKGALAAWGVNTTYKELGTTTLLPQTCAVCHDPHGTARDPATNQPWPGQLRFPITSPVIEVNLCTRCHNRRGEATPTNARGPHAAQGPVLFGTAGYFPPGTIYDSNAILTTHGSSANPRLCAGCHVNALTGVDAGGNEVSYSGHSFHPLPCFMPGSPGVVDTTFTNACPFDEPSRSWGACAASGCHSVPVAVQRFNDIRTEKEGYLDVLWVDLDGDETLDPYPADTGYLAKIQATYPDSLKFCNEDPTSTSNLCLTADDTANNRRLTSAKGALFNAQLLGDSLASHPDGSHGVHNPFLYRALLQSSIADLEAGYVGFLPAPPASVQQKIQRAIRSGELRMARATEKIVMRRSTH